MAPGSRLEGFYSPFASDSQGKDGIYVVSPSESTTSVNTAVDDGDTGSPGNHGVKRKLSLGSIHFAKRRSRLWPLFALAVAVIVVSLSSHLSGGVLVSFHSVSQKRTTICDPYALPGILRVNLTHPSEIVYSPILRPDCQPVDLISPLLEVASGGTTTTEVEFVRNRTIVVIGDSVDRHNIDFCKFSGGLIEMIGVDHPLSPPAEPAPANYRNPMNSLNPSYPNWEQSRPFLCTHPLGLRTLNIFHYGFRPLDDWLFGHAHYYAPALIEDRFDKILIPLMEGIAARFGVSAIPDVVSITPGFWGLLRMGDGDEKERIKLIASGVPATDLVEMEATSEMSQERIDWLTIRTEEVLRKLAGIWIEKKRPKLIWRPLHHILNDTRIPNHRIRIYNSIGERIVERLREEPASSRVKFSIDSWTRIMLGQEEHFVDPIHPAALPGSWVYWQSVLLQLKIQVSVEMT